MAASRSSTELVRGSYEAFNHGDRYQEIERYWHPELVFQELPYAPDSGTYRGYDGLRRFMARVDDAFDDVRYEPGEVVENGDRALVSVRMTGRGARHRNRDRPPLLLRLRAP